MYLLRAVGIREWSRFTKWGYSKTPPLTSSSHIPYNVNVISKKSSHMENSYFTRLRFAFVMLIRVGGLRFVAYSGAWCAPTWNYKMNRTYPHLPSLYAPANNTYLKHSTSYRTQLRYAWNQKRQKTIPSWPVKYWPGGCSHRGCWSYFDPHATRRIQRHRHQARNDRWDWEPLWYLRKWRCVFIFE